MNQLTFDRSKLEQDIVSFKKTYLRRQQTTFTTNVVLILLGILLSAGVTLSVILIPVTTTVWGLSSAQIAAVLGGCIAILISVQNAFPMGNKAEFYRLLVHESQNLLLDIDFARTDDEILEIQRKFKTLRYYAAKELPQGQGMETVKNMYRELDAKIGLGNEAQDTTKRILGE